MYVLACEWSQETRRVHVLGMLVLLILVNLVKKNGDRVVARLFVYVRIRDVKVTTKNIANDDELTISPLTTK